MHSYMHNIHNRKGVGENNFPEFFKLVKDLKESGEAITNRRIKKEGGDAYRVFKVHYRDAFTHPVRAAKNQARECEKYSKTAEIFGTV